MKGILYDLNRVIRHLMVIFREFEDTQSYKKVEDILNLINSKKNFVLDRDDRQIILSDLIEYLIFGRLFYYMQKGNKDIFLELLLYLVNLLMELESFTSVRFKRNKYLEKLIREKLFLDDEDKKDIIGLMKDREIKYVGFPSSGASKKQNKIFDSLLPKTAGGLWHELGVYAFMLNLDVGYIIPLLLHQRLFSYSDYLVPPDFLLLTYDLKIYGIEVGGKKEIQSGLFSSKTGIPTITIDTLNSRVSDRCPICKKWIQICPIAIKKFINSKELLKEKKIEIKCLEECDRYSKEEILRGKCPYTKYSRTKIKKTYGNHQFADGKHYHYQCVLRELGKKKKNRSIRNQIIKFERKALKTHIPYYSGFEGFIEREMISKSRY